MPVMDGKSEAGFREACHRARIWRALLAPTRWIYPGYESFTKWRASRDKDGHRNYWEIQLILSHP
jgi:hypothetical protein